ncbi:MAG: hypothetical protein ACRD2U_02040 [Terriglobales bacterium]
MRGKPFLSFLVLMIALPSLVFGQMGTPNQNQAPNMSAPPLSQQNPSQESPEEKESDERIQKAMQKKQNEERQAQLKRDTDKLLQLSTELKAYVDKTNQNVLSVDVIKKADQIEKLAHSVKEKMKGN